MLIVSYHRMRMRALFLRNRILIGMAFHLFVLKAASLPATFPTPWRGHPNMTEQGYVYPSKFKAAYPILSVCVSWLSQLEWLGWWVGLQRRGVNLGIFFERLALMLTWYCRMSRLAYSWRLRGAPLLYAPAVGCARREKCWSVPIKQNGAAYVNCRMK